MADEIVVPVVQHETEPKPEVKPEVKQAQRLTGYEENEHDHYLPPYYTAETWKIAQERAKK